MSQSSAVAGEATYFDLHTQGLGYLNRIREVTPSRGKAFLACTIAALNGPTEAPEYRYFDVTVCGAEAQLLVNRYAEAVDQGRKVLMGFRLGDLWTDLFRYSRGDKAGKTGVSLKARLLFISWIKVDGQLVYQAGPMLNPKLAQPNKLRMHRQRPNPSRTRVLFIHPTASLRARCGVGARFGGIHHGDRMLYHPAFYAGHDRRYARGSGPDRA